MRTKNIIYSISILFLLFISIIDGFAQLGGGLPGGGGQPSPISGLEILLGSGIILGLRKLVSNKKDK